MSKAPHEHLIGHDVVPTLSPMYLLAHPSIADPCKLYISTAITRTPFFFFPSCLLPSTAAHLLTQSFDIKTAGDKDDDPDTCAKEEYPL